MSTRFHALLAVAFMALAVTLAPPSQAQTPELAPPAEPPQPIEPPKDLPKAQRGDPTRNLDRLFAALKVAPTNESAKYIEGSIWAAWAARRGDTADAADEPGADRDRAARTSISRSSSSPPIIDIKPDYIEAWNRRATLYFHKRDYVSAMADLRAVLAREPRHFGAWAGLGMILQDVGDEASRAGAFRRAVELHPRMERIPDLVKKLTETVDGRDI